MFESCAVFWEIMIDSGSSGGNCLKPANSREVASTSHRSQTFNWIFIGSELCRNWWRCWLYLIDLKFVKLNETLVSGISSHEFFIIKPDVCLAKEKMAAGCIGGVVTLDWLWTLHVHSCGKASDECLKRLFEPWTLFLARQHQLWGHGNFKRTKMLNPFGWAWTKLNKGCLKRTLNLWSLSFMKHSEAWNFDLKLIEWKVT